MPEQWKLTSGGMDSNVKIFDKRESKIVQTFDGIHEGKIFSLFKARALAEPQTILSGTKLVRLLHLPSMF